MIIFVRRGFIGRSRRRPRVATVHGRWTTMISCHEIGAVPGRLRLPAQVVCPPARRVRRPGLRLAGARARRAVVVVGRADPRRGVLRGRAGQLAGDAGGGGEGRRGRLGAVRADERRAVGRSRPMPDDEQARPGGGHGLGGRDHRERHRRLPESVRLRRDHRQLPKRSAALHPGRRPARPADGQPAAYRLADLVLDAATAACGPDPASPVRRPAHRSANAARSGSSCTSVCSRTPKPTRIATSS